jgi:hypothetical protein
MGSPQLKELIMNERISRYDLVLTETKLAIDCPNSRHRFDREQRRWRPHRRTDQ